MIDEVLENGLKSLTWKDDDADKTAFIEETMLLVTDAHSTLMDMKNNMKGRWRCPAGTRFRRGRETSSEGDPDRRSR